MDCINHSNIKVLNQYPIFIINQYILQPTTKIRKWAKKHININSVEIMTNPMAITTKFVPKKYMINDITDGRCSFVGNNPHPIIIKILLEHRQFLKTNNKLEHWDTIACGNYSSNPHPKLIKKIMAVLLKISETTLYHEVFSNSHPLIIKLIKKFDKTKIDLYYLQQNRNKKAQKICMELLKESPTELNWYSLSKVTNPLILENKNKIKHTIGENPDKWAIDIIRKNKNKIYDMTSNPSAFIPIFSKSVKYWKELENNIHKLF